MKLPLPILVTCLAAETLATTVTAAPGSVFVQEVPDQARKQYERAAALMQKEDQRPEAVETLKKAIDIFPLYYDALELLGELAGDACMRGLLTFEEAKRAFEGSVLRAALAQASTTTEAALKLGLPQQTLSWILQKHHPGLKPKTRKPRRQRLIKPVALKSSQNS